MSARSAPLVGAALIAILGVARTHALSLKSSAAELRLEGSPPKARLRVQNPGTETLRVDFLVVLPPSRGLKDGCEPWPDPGGVGVTPIKAELGPGAEAETEIAATALPRGGPRGATYQFDVLATARDRAGASLTLRTRALYSTGRPPATAAEPPGGWLDRPGFTLSPARTAARTPLGRGKPGPEAATVKIVNAGEEDLTVTVSPAAEWGEELELAEGYEPSPEPRWLRAEPATITVRAGAIGSVRVWADVPRQPRYAGRKWAFVAAVDASGGGRATRRHFVLHAETREMEEEKRAR